MKNINGVPPENKIQIELTDDQAGKLGKLMHTALQAEGLAHIEICAYLRGEILKQLEKSKPVLNLQKANAG